MTIIKGSSQKTDKAILEKKLLEATLEEGGEPAAAPVVRVTHLHIQQKRRCCYNFFLILLALLVLAAGIVSGIYLYKHLSKKIQKGKVRFWCGTDDVKPPPPHYLPETGSQTQKQPSMMEPFSDHFGKGKHHNNIKVDRLHMTPFKVEQDVEVEDNKYEKIHMPKFGIFRETLVLHDFTRNFSGIVDFEENACYVMNLDRTKITPPKDWFDLIRKFASGYYMPKAAVLKRKYQVAEGPLKDLSKYGIYIQNECKNYNTYRLEKKVGDGLIEKRSAKEFKYYGAFNGRDTLFEYVISK